MADKRRNNKRRKQTYVPRNNAVHITLYSPSGDDIPADAVEKAEESVLKIALENRLLIGVATT